jgi:hypothetical protein
MAKDQVYDGSGQPKTDNKHVDQSNDGGEFTEQQTGGDSTGADPGENKVNDQSQNEQQTKDNLQAQQDRQAGEVDVVEPDQNSDPNDMRYNNPANPPVETRPVEQTAPTEDTPGYESDDK